MAAILAQSPEKSSFADSMRKAFDDDRMPHHKNITGTNGLRVKPGYASEKNAKAPTTEDEHRR